PASVVRNRPIASNGSSAKPNGSISTWQLLHAGLSRCCSYCARIVGVSTLPAASATFASSGGTSGGGGGGGTPRRLDRVQLPRITGDVRPGCDEVVSTLPLPSSPRRTSSSGPSSTRRKWLPSTFGIR